ncbi:MAG: protein-tyrosine-phosphatase [Acidisphaera sp.]|nr:protein-tyrosine-phosphatase [Acidisphaera sp.]
MLPFAITICGIDELPEHSAVGVSHVLSILDPDWPVPDAFGSYGEHQRLELRFNDVIEEFPGTIPPRQEHVTQLLAFGRTLLAEPARERHLLVHCHAGVSRSTASMLLMLAQAQPERNAEALAEEILRVRSKAWPNLRIVEMGDAELGRAGALVTAAITIYRAQLARRPELAAIMTDGGRGREVAAGQAGPPSR